MRFSLDHPVFIPLRRYSKWSCMQMTLKFDNVLHDDLWRHLPCYRGDYWNSTVCLSHPADYLDTKPSSMAVTNDGDVFILGLRAGGPTRHSDDSRLILNVIQDLLNELSQTFSCTHIRQIGLILPRFSARGQQPGAAEPRGPGGQLTPTFSGAGSTYGAWPLTFCRVNLFPICSCSYSFIHSLTHSFIHSFVRSFVRSSVRPFVRPSLTPSLPPSIHPFIHHQNH